MASKKIDVRKGPHHKPQDQKPIITAQKAMDIIFKVRKYFLFADLRNIESIKAIMCEMMENSMIIIKNQYQMQIINNKPLVRA